MEFYSNEMVVKISVSNMLESKLFYERVLGFKTDDRYTINKGGTFAASSYVQMDLISSNGNALILGLYKDIDEPYEPLPQTGTVPSFIIADIEETLKCFLDIHVVIDKIDGKIIQSNTSDKGYTDHFFFFRDPDNNSLVVRQNMPKS